MARIAKNYMYNLAYQTLLLIVPLVTAPYLARVLGAERLGIYGYVSSVGNIITTISMLGIYTYGNRQTAYARSDRGLLTETFWELELVRCVLLVVGTAVYIAYSCIDRGYSKYFLLYYPYIFAQFIDCSWLYVGLEEMKPAVLKNFAVKLVTVAGIFIVVRSREDVSKYILLIAFATLLGNISIYSQLFKYVGAPVFKFNMISTHLKGSLRLFLPQVASMLYLQVDKVMLQWITGQANQISFYDQAEKIITIPMSFITVLSTVMMPRIANEFKNGKTESVSDLLFRAGKFTLFMAMPMMLGIFCIAGRFIPWYLGSEYTQSAQIIRILSPIVLFNALAGISGKQYFTATNQTAVLTKAYVCAALLNIVVNAVLIPELGCTGAAIATVLSSLVSVSIQYIVLNKQINMRGLWRCGAKYAAGALLMSAVVLVLTHNRDASARTTVLQIFIGCVAYLAFIVITRDEVFKECGKIFLKKLDRSELK